MQPITDALAAILKAHYQAGADGFRARIEIDTPGSHAARLSTDGAALTVAETFLDLDAAAASVLRWQLKLRASVGSAGPGTLAITLTPDGVPTAVLDFTAETLTLREGASAGLGPPLTVDDADVTWYDVGDTWTATPVTWAAAMPVTPGMVVEPTAPAGDLFIWYPGYGDLTGGSEPDFASSVPGDYVEDDYPGVGGYWYNAGAAISVLDTWLALTDFSNADGDSAILLAPGNGRTYVAEIYAGDLTGATTPFLTPVDLAAYFYLAIEVDQDANQISAKAWPISASVPDWTVTETSTGGGLTGILLRLDASAAMTLLFAELRAWVDGVEVGDPFDAFGRGPLVGEWGTSDHGEAWSQDADDEAVQIAVEASGGTLGFRLMRASFDKSLTTDADRCEVDLDNSDGAIAIGAISPDTPSRIFAWYGDLANEIQVFSMLIDRVRAHRHPNMLTISGRDWIKKLIVQKLLVMAPQSADDPDAVRTTDNYVYLNWEISDIVTDLLDRAFFPGGASRDVQSTGISVDEFLGNDDEPFAAAISRLADIPGFLSYADELGVYHFRLNDTADPRDPDYTFRSGEDVLVLDSEVDDDQLYTRVRVTGPMTITASIDAWDEVWSTTVITHPVGAWYDPADSGNVRIIDSHTKRIYVLQQSDQSILSSWYVGASVPYPLGLSGDPGDATIYWVLSAPWAFTGGFGSGATLSGNRLYKFLKADNSLVASYALPNGRWTDLKVSAAYIWLTNWDNDQLWQFDLSAVTPNAGYSIGGFRNPTGLAINGTDVEVFFESGKSYVVDESAPTVITRTILSSADMWGGEYDTDTGTELFVVGSGHVWKYTTATTSETSVEVSAEAVDAALEAELLAVSGSAEIRRLVVNLPAILSQADAQASAELMLTRVNHFGNALDAGIIGNPALQKGDKLAIVDPVLGISSNWQLVSYRSELAGDSGTYLGTLSMQPWDVA